MCNNESVGVIDVGESRNVHGGNTITVTANAISGSAPSKQESIPLTGGEKFIEGLRALVDVCAVSVVFVLLCGVGGLLTSMLAALLTVVGVVRVLDLSDTLTYEQGVISTGMGLVLFGLFLVLWRISEPLASFITRRWGVLVTLWPVNLGVLLPSERWREEVKTRLFAAIDVVVAAGALLAFGVGFALCCYGVMLFFAGIFVDRGVEALRENMAFSLGFAMGCLFLWRYFEPIHTFFLRRLNDLIGRKA